MMEGYLKKKSSLIWKERFFQLKKSALAYYTTRGDADPRGELPLKSSSEVCSHSKKPFGFSVITDSVALVVAADSSETRKEWMDAVNAAIEALASSVDDTPSGYYKTRVGQHDFCLPRKYQVGRNDMAGHGAFGAVVKARVVEADGADAADADVVAIKKIVNVWGNVEDGKRIVREVRLLQNLHHPNIVNVLDALPPPTPSEFEDAYIVFEYMDTDLHRVIFSRQELSDDHVQYFIYQLLLALRYIHSKGVLHRDLKPSNVLVNISDCRLKLCDFGLSRVIEDEELQTDYVVTRWYRAPEIMLAVDHYYGAVDMWAAGCILVEMMIRDVLFRGDSYLEMLSLHFQFVGSQSEEDLSKFVTNPRAMRFAMGLPSSEPCDLMELMPKAKDSARDLAKKILILNPAERYTVQQALEHPFLAEYYEVEEDSHKAEEVDAAEWAENHKGAAHPERMVNLDDIEAVNLRDHHAKRLLQRVLLKDILEHFHPEEKERFVDSPLLHPERRVSGHS